MSHQRLKEKQIELFNNSIKDKKNIYLDLNYWIDFLKVKNGVKVRNYSSELLLTIESLVKENKVVVPISDIHIYEIYKNSNRDHFDKIIELFEDISNNICFVSSEERWNNEIIFSLRILFQIDDPEKYLFQESYTKPFFIKGSLLPDLTKFEINEQNDLSQFSDLFLDHIWNMSITKFFKNLDEETRRRFNPFEFENIVTDRLINGRNDYQNEYKDFKDLFGKEIWGSLEFFKNKIHDLIMAYFSSYKIGTSLIGDELFKIPENELSIRIMFLITSAIIESKQFRALPGISIGSGLHSLKRWNIKSNYKKSDSFDIMHAKVALTYCDYFFTEKNLCGLIKDSRLKFDKEFNVKVFSNPKEGLDIISTI
ncbi:MAG: hypothetical protein ACOCUV_00285 [bacterium]